MENFNKNLASIKPPIKGVTKKSNNENKLNPELASKLKSPKKNFMNPTISASIKASITKKKILGDRNETLDTLEQSSIGSNAVDSDDEPGLKPYDPVKNYLSPRPKYLRYDPDRHRKLMNLLENDDGRVKISACYDDGLQLGLGSSVEDSCSQPESVEDSCSQQESVEDSCSQQESIEEAHDVSNEEDEDENGEEYESEDGDDEFGEDGWFSLMGFFKFFLAVVAVILTAHAICSMKCPSASQTLDWHNHGLNFSEVKYGPVMEPGFLVGTLKEGGVYDDYSTKQDVFETVEEFVEVGDAQTDEIFVHRDEAENNDSNVIQDETVEEFVEVKNAQTDDDCIHQDEAENHDLNVIQVEAFDNLNQNAQTDDAENDDSNVIQDEAVDDIINQDGGLIEEDAADANDIEIANEMENEAENELDEIKTNNSFIKFTTFDLTIAVLVGGHMLFLTSLGAIFVSRRKKDEKEEFKNLEPSTKAQSLKEEEQFVTKEASLVLPSPPLQNDTISHVHNIPSVELLGEFVFGEEITSNISSTISSRMEMSTGDSHSVKNPRRKNAEVVTPSPVSVRRSSRLKTRSSVMSP